MFCDFRTHGVTGSVKVNGRERIVHKFRKQLCYITQEFAILDLLTARETLVVAADLKLNSDIKKEKKNETVSIIELINCKACMMGWAKQ
jgi:ABC-type multidrug transport system ATPase subunit